MFKLKMRAEKKNVPLKRGTYAAQLKSLTEGLTAARAALSAALEAMNSHARKEPAEALPLSQLAKAVGESPTSPPAEAIVAQCFRDHLNSFHDARFPGKISQLHDLRGKLETKLADFMGHADSYFYLAEAKRTWREARTEWTQKPLRVIQFDALRHNADLMAISRTCHFLIWGDTLKQSFKLHVASYGRCFETRSMPNETSVLTFFENLYSPAEPEARIGATSCDFRRYIEFLEAAGTPSSVSSETATFVIICRRGAKIETLLVRGLRQLINVVREAVALQQTHLQNSPNPLWRKNRKRTVSKKNRAGDAVCSKFNY